MPGKKILIVEDNPGNSKLAYVTLAKEGYDIKIAMNAEEALKTLEQFHPLLIIMDLQLPGMDGLQLTKLLKNDPRTQNIIIVALTAYAIQGNEEDALNAGCDDYITKPIDIHNFKDVVAKHLE